MHAFFVTLLNSQGGPSADLRDSLSTTLSSLVFCPVISICLGFTRLSALVPPLNESGQLDSVPSHWITAWKLSQQELGHQEGLLHLYPVYPGIKICYLRYFVCFDFEIEISTACYSIWARRRLSRSSAIDWLECSSSSFA